MSRGSASQKPVDVQKIFKKTGYNKIFPKEESLLQNTFCEA